MIIEDYNTYADRKLVRRYSDRQVMIANERGDMYSEAVDPVSIPGEYTETDIQADPNNPMIPAAEQDHEAERIAELEAELKRLKGGRN